MRNLIWAIPVAVAALALSACDATEPVQVEVPPESERWQTINDGDREFRCLTTWRKLGYAGGLAMWCYESEPR